MIRKRILNREALVRPSQLNHLNSKMERITSGDHHTSYKLGAVTITSLRDGYVDMPITRLRQPGNKIFGSDLPPQVRLVDGGLRLSVNAFAIDDGITVTLIDTGAANAWHPSMGFLPEALHEASIVGDRIRTVAFSHTHLDHIHGLILPMVRMHFLDYLAYLFPRKNSAYSGLRRDSNVFMTRLCHLREGNI